MIPKAEIGNHRKHFTPLLWIPDAEIGESFNACYPTPSGPLIAEIGKSLINATQPVRIPNAEIGNHLEDVTHSLWFHLMKK